MIDPEHKNGNTGPTRSLFMPVRATMGDSSAGLESSILQNKQKMQHDAKLKEDLISFMKQED